MKSGKCARFVQNWVLKVSKGLEKFPPLCFARHSKALATQFQIFKDFLTTQ